MNERYQSLRENPESLRGRFENGFPLVYPMDTVRVSSRLAGGGKNPLEGKSGYVHSISHGLQSRFNRDYLIVGFVGLQGNEAHPNESWLYTLDLINKDETTGLADSVLKQFGCLLFLDDRVKIVNPRHLYGLTGAVTSLQASSDRNLGLEIIDENMIKGIQREFSELNERIEKEFQKRNVDEGFSNFVARLKNKNYALYELLETEGKTRETFERLLRDDVCKEGFNETSFQTRLKEFQQQQRIFVSSKDVELVERFPPNDLFKS